MNNTTPEHATIREVIDELGNLIDPGGDGVTSDLVADGPWWFENVYESREKLRHLIGAAALQHPRMPVKGV